MAWPAVTELIRISNPNYLPAHSPLCTFTEKLAFASTLTLLVSTTTLMIILITRCMWGINSPVPPHSYSSSLHPMSTSSLSPPSHFHGHDAHGHPLSWSYVGSLLRQLMMYHEQSLNVKHSTLSKLLPFHVTSSYNDSSNPSTPSGPIDFSLPTQIRFHRSHIFLGLSPFILPAYKIKSKF